MKLAGLEMEQIFVIKWKVNGFFRTIWEGDDVKIDADGVNGEVRSVHGKS